MPMTAQPSSDVALLPGVPELLAPAGDWDCAKAAVENGADAVYFGLQDGFNARTRATNFTAADLPKLMTYLRTRGVKGYLTLNTLIFNDELEEVERTVRQAVAAGIDAVLVQDIGLTRLIHRLCPELPLHASTQMTLGSAECIEEAESLGIRRVVLPRELSIARIAAIRQQTQMELEAFVHGALCISYSGQCLASLSLGGRSANRGQCAQPCRLPYEVLRDGRPLDAEASDKKYALSPHDLAAYDCLPELIAAGVCALKIEGRLKPAEYVASVTRHYRAALDHALCRGEPAVADRAAHQPRPEDIAEMEMAFSRGFCHGWLDGGNHAALVSGLSSSKRGVCLGKVEGVRGQRIVVRLAGPVRRGDGVVFEGDRSQAAEQGGRVYEVFQGRRSVKDEVASGSVELAFRHGAVDPATIRPGQKLWKTDDPRVLRRLRKTYSGDYSQRRVALDLTVEATVGHPLHVAVIAATGVACRLQSPERLVEAVKHGLTAETLTEQFGRLGKTPYMLRRLDAKINGRPMIPLSVLGKLRHEMVRRLEAAATQPPRRPVATESVSAALGADDAVACQLSKSVVSDGSSLIQLHVLCRSVEQIEAALHCGCSRLIVDMREVERFGEAVQTVHAGGGKVLLATPRIHQPEESDVFARLASCRPDGILVRNLAGLAFFRRMGLPVVADYSLGAANQLAFAWLCEHGADRVTAACDLNRRRLLDLAAAVELERFEVVVHRHTPMFHSAHCVFCAMLSRGTNSRDCGRPCERHEVRLRDRLSVEHVLLADIQCRNTLFHADAASLEKTIPALREQGVRHFRVELLAENTVEQVRDTLAPFQKCSDGC